MPIKAVFFDIDNTLYDTAEFAERARRNAIRAMREAGLKASEQKAYSGLMEIVKKRTSNYPSHFDELLVKLGQRPSPRIIAAGVAAYHNTKASILPFPGVKETLLFLRDSGYGLYIASEGDSLKQWDKLIRLGLDCLFHDVFVTQEVGRKKSKGFYATLLKRLKLKKGEAVMVGDSEEKDVIPAKEAGMVTILVSKGRKKGKADYGISGLSEIKKTLG